MCLSGGIRHSQPSRLSNPQVVDGYIALFEQAMRRRHLPSRWLTMPLSGGRDSRQMLFGLLQLGSRPDHCLTFGPKPPNDEADTLVSQEVAAAVGIPHRVIWPRKTWLNYERRKNVICAFNSSEHTWIMPLADELAAYRGHGWFDGLGVGAFPRTDLLKPEIREPLMAGRYDEAARRLCGKTVSAAQELLPMMSDLLGPEAISPDAAVAAIAEQFAFHAQAPNPSGSFAFWNWNRRGISVGPTGLNGRHGHLVHVPLLDEDLYDLVSSIPSAQFDGFEPQTEAIHKAFPQYRHLRFDKDVKGLKKVSMPLLPRTLNTITTLATLLRISPRNLTRFVEMSVRNRRGLHRLAGLAVYLDQLHRLTTARGAQAQLAYLHH
jgi:hypothetical protein